MGEIEEAIRDMRDPVAREQLREMAADWFRQADELDPPGSHDDMIADTIEQAGYIGHAEGLRQAATAIGFLLDL